jgi:hypothetical protein
MPEVVAREQYEQCADTLRALPGVRAVDVLATDTRLDRPCIEVVIGPGYERVPPRVHRVIAEHDFGTRPDLAGARGQPRHFVVVVV